jgi:hypothetical protein
LEAVSEKTLESIFERSIVVWFPEGKGVFSEVVAFERREF